MTLPPLPEPDTHCFDDDTGLDVWSHSPDQMRAYGEACAAAERGLAEPQAEPMPGMSLMNRTIAYCAADTLRKLGYEWDGEAWVTTESQAEPVRECADNDSPWLVCKTCAAVGRCAKLPVAWRSKERINGEFDSGWKLTSNEPPQTPRTIAIEPLYTHPALQCQPLTKVQITELAEQCGYDGAVPTVRLAFQGFKLDDFARAIERHYGIEEAP